MENLTDRYEIIDGNRLNFRPETTEAEAQKIFETWPDGDNRPEITIIDMSECNIPVLRLPDGHKDPIKSLLACKFENLAEFVAPKSLERIECSYFRNCAKLRTVKFDSSSNSLTEIGEDVFIRCSSLKEIALPESLKKIGNYAFYNSSLEFLELPANIEEIEDKCFEGIDLLLLDLSRCVNIKELKLKVKANHVYLPVNLETLECEDFCQIEDLWVPPTLKRISTGKFGNIGNIWCYSGQLTSLKLITGYRTNLCVPRSLAGRYKRIIEAEKSRVKLFVIQEDGDGTQDYFWV